MKSVVGSLLVVALSILPAGAKQSAKKDEGKAVSGPRMEVTPEVHDFGKVEQNQKLVAEFEIKNIGTEELKIGRISTSCGCTAALSSDKLVEPGESTSLKVTFETRKYKGHVQRSVAIASNDPRRIRTIKVKAFVEESNSSS